METIKNNIEFSLTKTVNYSLKPFGKFKIKWKASDKLAKRADILPLSEISFDYNSGMPCVGDTDKGIVKFMIKNKTDVLVDCRGNYFTRIGLGFTQIRHNKLSRYSVFLSQRDYTDDDADEAWAEYIQ